MGKLPKNGSYVSFNNRRHKNPPPEEMIVNRKYAFTFNPEKQPLNPNFKLDLITWHNGIDNIFKSLKYCHVVLQPELSSGCRWHYHGYIEINDIMMFYIYDLNHIRQSGSYEIDTIENEITWVNYVCKQSELMKPICKKYGIPYTYDNTKTMKVKMEPLNDTKFCELIDYASDDGE